MASDLALEFPAVPIPVYANDHHDRRPEAPTIATHWACALLDQQAWDAVDRLQPATFPFPTPGTQALDVRVGDVVAARFEPVGAQVVSDTNWLTLEAFELLIGQHGSDDDETQVSDEWTVPGEAAMRAILAAFTAPNAPLFRGWRGELEVGHRLAEREGRRYSMSPAAIQNVTGRAYLPRRGLAPVGDRARELAVAKSAREDAEAAALREMAAAQVEAARERTVGELGLVCFAYRLDVLGNVPGAALPGLYGHTIATDAWPGSMRYSLWATDTERILGFLVPLGMVPPKASPVLERQGGRVLDGSTIVPRNAQAAAPPDRNAVEFLRQVRLESREFNFGPVAEFRSDDGTEQADEIMRGAAPRILSQSFELAFHIDLAAEQLVRKLKLRPDVAYVRHVEPALRERFRVEHPSTRVPVTPAHIEHVVDGPSRFVPPQTREVELVAPGDRAHLEARLREMRESLAEAALRGQYVDVPRTKKEARK